MRRLVILFFSATLATTAPAFAATMGSSAMPSCAAGDPVVWFNSSSKAEHMSGDKYYGKTKHGSYLCKSVADAQGGHASGKRGTKSSKHTSASTGPDTSSGDTSAGTQMNPASSDATPAATTGRKHRHRKGSTMASPAPEPSPT